MSEHPKGRLQHDRQRGVIYFHAEDGDCPLRIEGIPEVPEGHQIDIHLINAGGEHHHKNCGNVALVRKGATQDSGVICAVKLAADSKDRQGRTSPTNPPEGFETLYRNDGDDVYTDREKKRVSIDLSDCIAHPKGQWCQRCWPRVKRAIEIADQAMRAMVE